MNYIKYLIVQIIFFSILFFSINSFGIHLDKKIAFSADNYFLEKVGENFYLIGNTFNTISYGSKSYSPPPPPNKSILYVIKLNSSLELISFHKTYIDRWAKVSSVSSNKEDNIFIAINSHSDFYWKSTKVNTKGQKVNGIIQLSNTGDLVKYYLLPQHVNYIQKIVAKNENGFVIMGNLKGSGKYGGKLFNCDGLFLAFFASYNNGKLEWVSIMDKPILSDMVISSTDDLIFSGWFYKSFKISDITIKTESTAISFIGKYDSKGNLSWLEKIGGESSCDEFHSKIHILNNEEIIISGSYCGEGKIQDIEIPFGYKELFFAKLSSSGHFSWINRLCISNNYTDRYAEVTGINEGKNGLIWLSTNIASESTFGPNNLNGNGKIDGAIVGFDISDGNLICLKNFGGMENDRIAHLYLDNDNDMIFSAFMTENTAKGCYLIKVSEINNEYIIPFAPNPAMPLQLDYIINMLSHDAPKYYMYNKSLTKSDKFLVFSTSGYPEFGWAAVSLVKLSKEGIIILKSYGHFLWNKNYGFNLNQSIDFNGDYQYTFDKFLKNSISRTDSISEKMIDKLINTKGTHYFFPLSDQVVSNSYEIYKKINFEIPPISYSSSFSERKSFYQTVGSNFKLFFQELNLDYSPAYYPPHPIKPQQVIDGLNSTVMLGFNQKSTLGQLYELFDYSISTKDQYKGEKVNGIPHGKGKAIFINKEIMIPNGNSFYFKSFHGTWKNGLPHGTGTLVYESTHEFKKGNLTYKGGIKNGLPNGTGVLFDQNSNIIENGIFEHGELKNGEFFMFDKESNTLKANGSLENFKLQGKYWYYYTNSKIIQRLENFNNGLKDGKQFNYYPYSGNLERVDYYHDGKTQGESIHYFYDGMQYDKSQKKYIDMRSPSQANHHENQILYSDYKDYNIWGYGHLHYTITGDQFNPKSKRDYFSRVFNFSDGSTMYVKKDSTAIFDKDGSVLICNFGSLKDKLVLSHTSSISGKSITSERCALGFYGNYKLLTNNGGIIDGTYVNESLEGDCEYTTPGGEKYEANMTLIDSTYYVSYSYTVTTVVVSKTLAGKLLNPFVEFGEEAIRLTTEFFQGFEESLCKLVGKDPGEDCTVCVGGQGDTDGNVQAMDCYGEASAVPDEDEEEIPKDLILEPIELEPFLDGTYRFIAKNLFNFGDGWPNLSDGFSVFPVNLTGQIRGVDDYGNGAFMATRYKKSKNEMGQIVNEKYLHGGTDYTLMPNDPVYSPVSGTVERFISNCYDKNDGLQGIIIKDGIHTAKILYFKPDSKLKPGDTIKSGQVIGNAQDIQGYYKKKDPIKNMTNHIHVQLYDGKGRPIPPDYHQVKVLIKDYFK